MPQGELIKVENGEYGTLLTFDVIGGGQLSYSYNGNLTLEQLEKLKGQHISFDNIKGAQVNKVYKAWNEEGKVVHSEIPFDGDDRGSR